MTDHELVRPSRDGDQFHYHWAARHCLALLPGSGDLVAISIEGASKSEGAISNGDGEELIDVGFYYGSEALEDARSVHYVQLKHSTQHAQKPWTASGLKTTLRGFAKRFSGLLQQMPAAAVREKFQFKFTTNRPIERKVQEALDDLTSTAAPRHPSVQDALVRYTGLVETHATEFFRIFSTDAGEPSLWAQRNLLTEDVSIYLAGTDVDSPVQLKELITRKATSEFAADPTIRRHDVLRALKVTEIDLLPAPCLIVAPADMMSREQEAEVRESLLAAKHPIVLHADGGVGKSVLASRLAASMPGGSVAVLYDCFGDGLYRNALNFRHRHRDALVQIANELATQGLCHPLIPSAHSDAKNFMRAFVGRLKQAIGLLRAQDPQASLCLIIDAADNADMAAEEQGETAFVRDLIRTAFPDGVKLVFTCRTHRRERLSAPTDAHQIELRPFTQAETTELLLRTYPEATDEESAEFAFLSSGNPRVQALALSRKLPIEHMLKELGPTPSSIERAIGELLQRAIDKLKDQGGNAEATQIDLICQGLAVLRPLVPISILAQISGIPESAIRSFAFDLGRPLLVKGNSLHFLDEPAETWFRERFKPDSANLASFLARLGPLAKGSSYVASTLPQLLLSAGRMDELVEMALSEEGLPTTNPLERRDVELQRLTFALKACLQNGRYADAAKLALKSGGEAAGEARQTRLIQDNTDIAAILLPPDRIAELVSRRTFGATWMGSHHAYDAGLLSGRDEFLAEAGSRLRMAMDWLYAWSRLPEKEGEDEYVDDADRAELAMAHLRVLGPKDAARFLTGWRPRRLAFKASKQLARRLIDLGQYEQLDSLAKHGSNDLWLLLGLTVEASRVGHCISSEPMARLMHILSDRRIRLQDSTQWDEHWDALEAVTAAVSASLRVLPRDDTTWAQILQRHLPDEPPSTLWDRFGSDRTVLLRAYALEAALRGESLSLQAIAPLDVRKEMEALNTHGRSADTVAFERSTGGVLPWFVLGAEISCGRTPSDLGKAFNDALEVTTRAASEDYQHQFNIEQVAALEWIRLLRESSATGETFVRALRAWIGGKEYRLWPDTLTSMCRIAARTKELLDLALELAVATLESLEASRENAEARTDAYQRLSRAVLPVSRAEAAAYFDRAVEISSRIGDENLDRWSALLRLAEASAQHGLTRPCSAYRLSRVAELTYEYVDRDKHFDWQRTIEALLGLCAPSALAILSRWRDRNFGDAGRLFRMAVYSLVRAGRLPAIAPVALSGLDAGWDSLDDIKRAVDAITDSDERRFSLRVGYRYMRVVSHDLATWADLAELGRALDVELPDIERLLAATRAAAQAPTSLQSHRTHDSVHRSAPDWDQLFGGVDLANPEALRQTYLTLKTLDPPYQISEFYKQGVKRSGPGKMAEFVRAIATWPDFGVFELRDLLDAVPAPAVKLFSLRKTLREAILTACRNTPEYAQRRGWGSVFSSERLYAQSIVSDDDVVTAILEGFARRIDTLDARDFFLLLDPLSTRISSDAADSVLNFGLDLLEDVLRAEDGDGPWHLRLTPPPSIQDALAGYLWVSLGSPAAGERWQTAHAVRSCIELDWTDLLSALATRACGGSAAPFADHRLVFYEWHARQWLMVALARGSIDRPTAMKPFIPFIEASAKEAHVLLRHFASETLKALHCAGVVPLETIADFGAINVGRLPAVEYSGWRGQSPDEDVAEEIELPSNEKYYFGIDIGPYWFAPLGRAFGLNQGAVEQRARQVLRDQMSLSYGRARDDARYKLKIFRDRDTSHSHHDTPRVDDLRAYNSYHAMMIVAARLLATCAVGKRDDENRNDFEQWLERQLLTRSDGRWLADRRDPQLVEVPPKPHGYGDKTWCWSVTAGYLDRQLSTDDGLQVLWGCWSSGSRDDKETVFVRSALVAKDGADALIAALQTSPRPDNIFLPGSDEPEVPDTGNFRLAGWLATENESARLDEYDPWADKLYYPGPRPDACIVEKLGLSADADSRRWVSASGSLLRSESWTRLIDHGREQERDPGNRLSCDRSFLHELLKAHPKDYIVISVSVRREPPRGGSDKDEFQTYPWPYVRYYLLGDDGIARSLKSRD
ncbi:NACHT domain-containing protein [Paraburkholderia bryophila]|uniref:AVAST type 3 anti-phage nuclease/ATPase Avs3a n=1 Tax=Paraburkholderia bryophila TaxID=420952 RepID=UPI00234BFE5C|nr:AVAST type 3 anti-phage nuclease/ATPase Avs3a [Paraburkholderia bryophila]WCM24690.1 NACHT domain-containing protein [Paraburkholderia bryophila]